MFRFLVIFSAMAMLFAVPDALIASDQGTLTPLPKLVPKSAADPAQGTTLAPLPKLVPRAQPGLVAEPQVPSGKFTTAAEVKPIMSVTKANWLALNELDNKELLYVTQIWSWRCGLVQMRLGVNGGPLQVWPLPPCHENTASPNAIIDSDGLPFAEFARGSIAVVEVELTFDDLTTDSARFPRTSILMP